MGGELLEKCLAVLREGCEAAEETLREIREAVGKHRGKGGGIARVLRRAAQALGGALEPCIKGCSLPATGETPAERALRCSLGEALEELQRSLHGIAFRLERLPRLTGETEEELAEALLDAVAAAVAALCSAAARAEEALEA